MGALWTHDNSGIALKEEEKMSAGLRVVEKAGHLGACGPNENYKEISLRARSIRGGIARDYLDFRAVKFSLSKCQI